MFRLLSLFASWRTTASLLVLYAVAVAVATLLEARYDTNFARLWVYHSGWFIVLNALLVLNFVAIASTSRQFARRRYGVLMLHYGFIVVLAGAMVTHLWGYEGTLHLRMGQSVDRVTDTDGRVRELPFTLTLDGFELERYRGSQTPSGYRSDLTVEQDGERRQASVSVNNVLYVDGFRLYQSSYDSDEQGTVLTVNSDLWGTVVSYWGYLMLALGLVWALAQRGSRFRTLYAGLAKGTLCLALLLGASSAQGQVKSSDGERFGALAVMSPDGRLHPISTLSSQYLRKIYHADSYQGKSANQVILSIVAYPEVWYDAPIIFIPKGELRRELGGEYLPLKRFFDPQGNYTLAMEAERIYALPRAELSRRDKDVLKVDEKINILYGLMHGTMLPLFPVDGGDRWVSSGDSLGGARGMDSMFVRKAVSWFRNTIDEPSADNPDVLAMIAKYQQSQLGDGLNATRLKAEVFYNEARFFVRSFRAYLALGLLSLGLGVAMSVKRRRWLSVAIKVVVGMVVAVLLFQSCGIALRWYISERAPWANSYETMVYLSWVIALGGLIALRRSRLVFSLAVLLASTTLFVANLNWLDPRITSLAPVLDSPWLMLHVSVVTASYGFFGIAAMIGLVSIGLGLWRRDISSLRAMNEMAVMLGLVLLTIGIFMGAVWANESWGRYWGWDPKESWALVTMIVYALMVHLRFMPRTKGDMLFSVLSVLAIATVLMTFFGVNYLLSGLHSYA